MRTTEAVKLLAYSRKPRSERKREKEISHAKQREKKCGTDFHKKYRGEKIAKGFPPLPKR